MIVVNIATGIVNFFSFLALLSTNGSAQDFSGALFLFCSSVFLVGLSLFADPGRPKSLVYSMCSISLLIVSVAGISLPLCTLFSFIEMDITVAEAQNADVIVKSVEGNLFFIRAFSINRYIYIGGLISVISPFVLAIRAGILGRFRREYYSFEKGYFRK